MVLIDVSEENKKRLDAISRELAARRMVKGVSYNESVTEVLDIYDKLDGAKTEIYDALGTDHLDEIADAVRKWFGPAEEKQA